MHQVVQGAIDEIRLGENCFKYLQARNKQGIEAEAGFQLEQESQLFPLAPADLSLQ